MSAQTAPQATNETKELDTPQKKVDESWSQQAYQLDLTGMAKQVVINSVQHERTDESLTLLVNSSIQPMMNDKIQQDVVQALCAFYKAQLSVKLEFSAQLTAETPVEYQQRLENEAKAEFIDTLNQSDFAQSMKHNFNAVLLEHSVKKLEH